MKKYLLASVLIGLFFVIPVHAQTSNIQQTTLQQTLDSLRAQLSQLYSQLPAAVTIASTKSFSLKASSAISAPLTRVDENLSPIPSPHQTAPHDCNQILLPFGMKGQTVRCDGANWVADNYLLNFSNGDYQGVRPGVHVGDNWYVGLDTGLQSIVMDSGRDVALYAYNKSPEPYGAAVKGSSDTGTGILGSSQTSYGLYGLSSNGIGIGGFSSNNIAIRGWSFLGKGVEAATDSGYGFYQEGNLGRNNLEGTLNVGYVNSESPAEGVKIKTNGGIQITDTQAAPGCASSTRGTFWFVQGSLGIKDTAQVCAKDAAGTYAWRTLY